MEYRRRRFRLNRHIHNSQLFTVGQIVKANQKSDAPMLQGEEEAKILAIWKNVIYGRDYDGRYEDISYSVILEVVKPPSPNRYGCVGLRFNDDFENITKVTK